MQRVDTFLASSIDELSKERISLGDFNRKLNNILVEKMNTKAGIFECEYADKSMSTEGSQAEIDKRITAPCDVFFNIYKTRAGKYTVAEYELALKTRLERGKPEILVCVDANEFNNNATPELSAHIESLRQIKEVKLIEYTDFSQVKLNYFFAVCKCIPKAVIELNDGDYFLNGVKIRF